MDPEAPQQVLDAERPIERRIEQCDEFPRLVKQREETAHIQVRRGF
jgi:hypothetical protein